MKKTLLTLSVMLLSIVGVFAETKTYTQNIAITMGGEDLGTQQANIEVEMLPNNTANFTLKNFFMGEMPIGTISMQGATALNVGYDKLFFNGEITIQAGDTPGVEYWMGPDLDAIPVLMKAKIQGDSLIAHVDIDLGMLGQVHVAISSENVVGTKTYTNQPISVDLGIGEPMQQTGDIVVETLEDGEINFTLKNFCLDEMAVGNINIKDINVTKDHNCNTFTTNESILIAAGDEEGEWMGPSLGFIPIEAQGKLTENNLYVGITINIMEMNVAVTVGTDFDAIESLNANANANANVIYNLAGQQVQKATRGLYIINGQKVIR